MAWRCSESDRRSWTAWRTVAAETLACQPRQVAAPSSSRRWAVGQWVSLCTITNCGTPTQASSSDQALPAVIAK